MEQIIPFLVMVALGLIVAPIVLAVIAVSKARELEGKLKGLERRLNELFARGIGTEAQAPGATEAAREARAPAAPHTRDVVPPIPSTPAAASAMPPLAPPTPPAPPAAPAPRTTSAPTPPRVPATAPAAPAAARASRDEHEWGSTAGTARARGGLQGASDAEPRTPEVDQGKPERASGAPKKSLERVIGVTGAAIVGGVILAIAGFYLFQYTVQQGLLTPEVRVILGTITGIVCIAGSGILRKRGYAITADAIAGGGAVVLYAAFWAAHAVFSLWPFGVAFALMALVTAVCCFLSWRHGSQLIAVLGLIGGFATPLLLSSNEDRPVGLFGYVLLLDLAFLFVAQKRRWPSIAMIGLLGTFVIQALWIFDRMSPATFALGLVVLGLFAILFVAFAASLPSMERARWALSQAGAVFLPFLFALYFAARSDPVIGWHLYPMALLALLLCVAASWMARTQDNPWISTGAAAGSVALVLVWVVSKDIETARAWELATCCAVLAGALHVFCEWKVKDRPQREEIERGHALSAAIGTIGFLVAAIIAAAKNDMIEVWPWIAALLLPALLLSRQSALRSAPWLQLAGSVGTSLGVLAWSIGHEREAVMLAPPAYFALWVGLVLVFELAAMVRKDAVGRRAAWIAAFIVAAFAFSSLQSTRAVLETDPEIALGGRLLFGVIAAIAAGGARSGFLLGAAIAMTALSQGEWSDQHAQALAEQGRLLTALTCEGLGVVAFTLWPFFARKIWNGSRGAWRAASLAAPLWFFPLKTIVPEYFGKAVIGGLPLALAILVGCAAWRLSHEKEEASADPKPSPLEVGRIWYWAFALCFASAALPLQLDHDWELVAAPLCGMSLAFLWKRFGHPALQAVAVVLITFASAVLVLARLFDTMAGSESLLLNWISYTYLVPAAGAIVAAVWMRPSAVPPAKDTEVGRYAPNPALASSLATLSGLALIFAWINLAILNAFGEAVRFDWSFEHVPARDMTISIAWAVYALTLLVLGVGKKIGGLRWVSLSLLVLTIAKVFLFDLGTLGGLYRVASLFGLAVSLFLVSLLYQRFVFRRTSAEAG